MIIQEDLKKRYQSKKLAEIEANWSQEIKIKNRQKDQISKLKKTVKRLEAENAELKTIIELLSQYVIIDDNIPLQNPKE